MAMTQVSSLSISLTAWKQLAYFALRPELYFDSLCDVDSTDATTKGATVKFDQFADLAAATTPLTETSDVTPVALSDSQVTVTLQEYGNAVQTTAKLRATGFIPVNPVVANCLGYNAGLSTDTIAQTAFAGGSNVIYSTGAARTSIAASNVATTKLFAQAVAKLRGNNSQPFGDGLYRAIIHPDVSYDIRTASLGNTWGDPHVYSDPTGVYNGVVGAYAGARFMESPRAPLFADASNGSGSTGTVDVYGTLLMGRQAVAKGFSTGEEYGANPAIVDSPTTDLLRRFQGMGWKHFVGYSVFRQASLYRVESASSIGVNT